MEMCQGFTCFIKSTHLFHNMLCCYCVKENISKVRLLGVVNNIFRSKHLGMGRQSKHCSYSNSVCKQKPLPDISLMDPSKVKAWVITLTHRSLIKFYLGMILLTFLIGWLYQKLCKFKSFRYILINMNELTFFHISENL